jgi:hypothetical protein
MELAYEMIVVGVRERQGVGKEEEREVKMRGREGMKEERREVRQMERMRTFVAIGCTMNLKRKRRYNVTT